MNGSPSARLQKGIVAIAAALLTSTALATASYAETTDSPASSAPATDQLPPSSETPPPSTPSSEQSPAEPSTAAPTTSEQASPPVAPQPAPAPETPSQPASEPAAAPEPAADGHSPEGQITGYRWTSDKTVEIDGWGFDRDDLSSAVPVLYTYDGVYTSTWLANDRSPELDAYGLPYKGIRGPANVTAGTKVCAYAANTVGGGSTTFLGCITPSAPALNPEGALTAKADGSNINVSGWAIDRSDLASQIGVWIVDNGKVVGQMMANQFNPQYAAYGLATHAYNYTWATTPGEHNVCLYGLNIGSGQNTWIACQTVTVPSTAHNPRGDLAVSASGGQITATGWAIDESDLSKSIGVWVVDNGKVVAQYVAAGDSSYLYAYGVGGFHGFGSVWKASPGTHNVCVYGLNVGAGQNAWIGCKTVTV